MSNALSQMPHQNAFNFDLRFCGMSPQPIQPSPSMNMMNSGFNSCFVFPPPMGIQKQATLKEKHMTFGLSSNLPIKVTASHSQCEKEDSQKKLGKKTKRKNLSIREDVMNKNIFRDFKRELKNLFQTFMNSNNPNPNPQKDNDNFMGKVKEFTVYSLHETNMDLQGISGFDLDVCKTYMEVMLDY
jgi:hypothetical protein